MSLTPPPLPTQPVLGTGLTSISSTMLPSTAATLTPGTHVQPHCCPSAVLYVHDCPSAVLYVHVCCSAQTGQHECRRRKCCPVWALQ